MNILHAGQHFWFPGQVARVIYHGLICAFCLVLGGCATPQNQPRASLGLNIAMGDASPHDASTLLLVTMRLPDHLELTGGADIASAALPSRYATLMRQWETQFGLQRLADWELGWLSVRCLVFKLNGKRSREDVVRELSKATYVETVQPLQEFNTLAEPKRYNDPYLKLQHGFETMQVNGSHHWATGANVKVAVIDTGIDTRHPDLRNKITFQRNVVDGRLDNFDADVHGTAVAAVIAATANNAEGLVGVAPDAQLLAVKACWQERPGYSGAVCNSFTLAKALDVAMLQQPDVINLSLGGPSDPLLSRMLSRALQQGVVVVGAADRRNPNGFPASTQGVISVDTEGRTRDASNRFSLRAPGERVVSARPQAQYDTFSGSSISSAQVAGIAALIRQLRPHLSGQAIAAVLAGTSDTQSGNVNACRALARVLDQDGLLCD